jgi:hypothetical protein
MRWRTPWIRRHFFHGGKSTVCIGLTRRIGIPMINPALKTGSIGIVGLAIIIAEYNVASP